MILRWNQPLPDRADILLQKVGYQRFRPRHNPEQESFVIPLGKGFYPRFHAYIHRDDEQEVVITLHLDQTPCTYVGGTAHAGEYDAEISPALAQEAERIRNSFLRISKVSSQSQQLQHPWFTRLLFKIFGK
jgi:hypothetical protein